MHPKRKGLLVKKSIATIGFFDGVHRGHLYLIDQMCTVAKKRGMESMIVTFDRHPREVLHTGYIPQLLSTQKEKVERLMKTPAQRLEVLPFTSEMSRLTASEFMEKVLRTELGVSVLMMGYDHQFGHGGGSYEDYVKWGVRCGIEVLQAHELEGERVSSSRIRSLLDEGRLAEANALLGYCYTLNGIVKTGHQVGRKLGFPTANLHIEARKLVPANGVYAVRAILPDGKIYPAVMNIGNRPTLQNGCDVTVEAHLLRFEGNLYHKDVRLEMVERLRDESHFCSTEELKVQIREDAERALHVLEEQ